MIAEIVKADESHIPWIAERVRSADREELKALAYLSPEDALTLSLGASATAWTGLVNGEPVCMFGVAATTILTDTGRPWMIGTEALDRYQRTFLRRCRPVVAQMLEMFERLENHIDCRNERAIKWLEWLGFSFNEPEPYGLMRLPFRKFYMERACS